MFTNEKMSLNQTKYVCPEVVVEAIITIDACQNLVAVASMKICKILKGLMLNQVQQNLPIWLIIGMNAEKNG